MPGMRIDQTIAAVIGIGFAAFAIWLVIRIVNRRERWAIIVFAILALAGTYAAIFLNMLDIPADFGDE
jgi:hypothetical protein